MITIGTGLLRISDHGNGRFPIALIFVTGIALAGFAGIATRRQVGYQHAAREQATKIAKMLGVSELAIASTPGWRGRENRWWDKARTVNYALLVVLGAVNAAGVAYVGVVH